MAFGMEFQNPQKASYGYGLWRTPGIDTIKLYR